MDKKNFNRELKIIKAMELKNKGLTLKEIASEMGHADITSVKSLLKEFNHDLTWRDVYNEYKKIFGTDDLRRWRPYGYLTIEIQLKDELVYIFDYESKKLIKKEGNYSKVENIKDVKLIKDFKKIVKEKLKKNNLSVEDFSLITGIDISSLEKYLNGVRTPHYESVVSICKCLNIDIYKMYV